MTKWDDSTVSLAFGLRASDFFRYSSFVIRVSGCRVLDHPRVFAAAALRRVDHQGPFFERYTGQPAREHENVFAIYDIEPYVPLPSLSIIAGHILAPSD